MTPIVVVTAGELDALIEAALARALTKVRPADDPLILLSKGTTVQGVPVRRIIDAARRTGTPVLGRTGRTPSIRESEFNAWVASRSAARRSFREAEPDDDEMAVEQASRRLARGGSR